MKLNDQQMFAAISAAISELTSREISDLCMQGGRLELDFETRQAKLWPGERTKVHPHPTVVVDPDESKYPISGLKMWLPPFPGSESIRQQRLSDKGWQAMFEWVRSKYVKSIELWIRHLGEIEESALRALNSQAPHAEPA